MSPAANECTPKATLLDLPIDLFMGVVGALEDVSIVSLRATCTTLSELFGEDFWIAKVTSLLGTHAGLGHFERGENEPASNWYGRLTIGVMTAEAMAHAHAAGDQPYMKMYGSFVDNHFVPKTPLLLPAPYGLIAERCRRLPSISRQRARGCLASEYHD